MAHKGQVAIVTGSGGGIGRQLVLALAKEECSVVVTDMKESILKESVEVLKKEGIKDDKILDICANLTKEDDCKNIVDKTIAKFGKLDILINCAGVLLIKQFGDTTVEEFDKIFGANTKSTFLMCKLSKPHLIKTKGSVVNFGSVASMKNFNVSAIYGAAKAAVDHMTRSFALEVAPHGVRVNGVNPGFVRTPLYANAGMPEAAVDAAEKNLSDHSALERPADVQEVVQAVMFLAGSKSSYITGCNLPVDGGSHAK